MLRLVYLVVALVSGFSSSAFSDPWTTAGLQNPESVLTLPDGRFAVSQMRAFDPNAEGGGSLALLAPDGSILDLTWVEGLRDPKGMSMFNGDLFVADVTMLVRVDVAAGAIVERIPVEGAQFLNDVASDEDTLWVTDVFANSVFSYNGGEVTTWLQTSDLEAPNGILATSTDLWIATIGPDLKPDFSTSTDGGLLRISRTDRSVERVFSEVGSMDGVVLVGGRIFINDSRQSAIYEMSCEGLTVVHTAEQGMGDLSTDGAHLILPMILLGEVRLIPLPEADATCD